MNIDSTLKVITVSASGALAPGPLTAATAALGARKGWKAGVGVAVGHTIVELPLVLLIAYGLGGLLANLTVRLLLGLAGGAFMLFFGYLTMRASLKTNLNPAEGERARGTIVTGAALSLFNPFFITWWLGVGSPLVAEAITSSRAGLLAFYATHVWLDYAWLTLVAAMGSLSRLNTRAYRVLLAALALLVTYFGISMIVETARQTLAA